MKWVLLVYKLPKAKTTAKKVAIWRKLKKLAVYPLQDSVCILPYSERTLENFEWLAEEIKEMGGDATLWETIALDYSQEDQVKEYFLTQVNKQYKEIMDKVENAINIKQLQKLWTLFHQIKSQDYLRSPLWIEVKGLLEKKASELSGKDE
ncbi:Chromate resistance protein ChrB [Desulforamulus aquiferis]|uniref:ChrB N-terminal domain-containing protein n=1 Tax=Desulforamulus aquiferis TaxID=1397668 RepID=A0AAW7ZE90_9FIRM|nr:Chromate resistance protein ChrB [Desulforamulus aquiferis]MDO7787612.1 hypothetical protein [Desulforamulus aquiferis]RYD03017.1 hypothetical protein N752_21645 [Desulforamulus aquiferis]